MTNELIKNNLGLVTRIVNKFANRGIEYEDLFQIGCLGLVEANKKFKPELGYQFSTFAVPMIRGRILRYIRENNYVHIPHCARDKFYHAFHDVKSKLGHEPTTKEMAENSDLPEKDILFFKNALSNATSTNVLLNSAKGKDTELESTLKSNFSLEDEVIHKFEIKMLHESINNLPEKQRKVILLRLKEKTQVEIGEIIGVKQVQVSRLLKRAIINLKKLMGSDDLMIKKNEAIKLIKEGLDNKQIAERLDSSPNTISVYRTQYNESMKNTVFAMFDTGKDVPQIAKALCINGNTIFKFKEEWLKHHKEINLNTKNDSSKVNVKKDFQEIIEKEKAIQEKKLRNNCIAGNGVNEVLHFKPVEPKKHILKATQYKGMVMDYNLDKNTISIHSKENASVVDISKENIELFIQELTELKEVL